jgi:glycosyltransferase involved in cell wall biosynthesis
MTILYVTNNLNFSNGITTCLYHLSKELKNKYGYKIIILCSGGDSLNRFWNEKIHIISTELINHNNRSVINYCLSILYTAVIVARYKVNIIHAQDRYTANISYGVSKVFRRKFFYTLHSEIDKRGRLKDLVGNNIISVSDHLYRSLILRCSKDKRIFHIKCGMEIPKIVQKGKAIDKIKVVSASRLVYGKGVDLFINAIDLMPLNIKEKAEFFIGGSGEEKLNLEQLAASKNIKIEFLGSIESLNDTFRNSHIFVMPTRLNEGLGLTIVEAAINYNLVISSNYAAATEIIVNGEDGILFENNNSIDLADKLSYAIREYKNLFPNVESLRNKVIKMFDIRKTAAQINYLYRDV